ncbi:Uncharacterised protein [Mycobacterium tuberculosis]|nr:Uncharacterised protein [Mycobacterium tuberculosis]
MVAQLGGQQWGPVSVDEPAAGVRGPGAGIGGDRGLDQRHDRRVVGESDAVPTAGCRGDRDSGHAAPPVFAGLAVQSARWRP